MFYIYSYILHVYLDEVKASPKAGKLQAGNINDPNDKSNVKIDPSENHNESDVNDLEEGSEEIDSDDEVDENDDEEEETDENYETEDKDSEVSDEGDSGIEEEEFERKPKKKEPKPALKDAKEGRPIWNLIFMKLLYRIQIQQFQ